MTSWRDDYTRSRALPVDTYDIDDIIGRKDGAALAAESTCSGTANIIQTTFSGVNQSGSNTVTHASDPSLERMVQVAELQDGATGVPDTTLDFDVADEGDFIQEDTVSGTDFITGSVVLHADFNLRKTLDNPNASGTSAGDNFGYSVSISDSYILVGANNEDAGSGKAYIFNPDTGALLHTLDNPNAYDTSSGDQFGSSVAISDSYAAVGTPNEDDPDGDSSGKTYIFNTATGALLHTLDNPNASGTSHYDKFGSSVSISDSYVLVGAYLEDDAYPSSGKAYIFNTISGTLLHTLDNPNAYGTSELDNFGISVAVSEYYAAVSANAEDDADGTSSGKVYIFNTISGTLLHTLDNPNPYGTSGNDLFGSAIAISDSYILVGAHLEDADDGININSGKAYIFDVLTGNLLHTLDNPNAYGTSNNDRFGYRVAISDTYVVVGAYGEDYAGGVNSGKAYIFDPTTGELLYTLDNPNAYGTPESDNFSDSLAVSNSYILVGAQLEDDAGGGASGKAYIFNSATYPTNSPYYLTTSTTNNIWLDVVETINTVTISGLEPTNTSLGALVSFDDRTTWHYWDGDSFEPHAGLTTKTGWSTISGIEAGLINYTVSGTDAHLDFAFLLETTDSGITPSVDQININYDENDFYRKQDNTAYSVHYVSSTKTKVTKLSTGTDDIKVNIILGE